MLGNNRWSKLQIESNPNVAEAVLDYGDEAGFLRCPESVEYGTLILRRVLTLPPQLHSVYGLLRR